MEYTISRKVDAVANYVNKYAGEEMSLLELMGSMENHYTFLTRYEILAALNVLGMKSKTIKSGGRQIRLFKLKEVDLDKIRKTLGIS